MKSVKLMSLLIGLPLLLAGCGSQQSDTSSSTVKAADPVARTGTKPVQQNVVIKEPEPRDYRSAEEKALWDRRLVHFDFDDSTVKAKFRNLIEAHARYLANNPDTRVSLDGHADQRGTGAYNYGLGKRRSLAVREILIALGAPAGNIRVTSYGEDLPAIENAITESSFEKNRRVEFHYLDGELAAAPLSHESSRLAKFLGQGPG